MNVARAGLDELLLDYEDFLRQRGLKQWEKDDPEARRVREVGVKTEIGRISRIGPIRRIKKSATRSGSTTATRRWLLTP